MEAVVGTAIGTATIACIVSMVSARVAARRPDRALVTAESLMVALLLLVLELALRHVSNSLATIITSSILICITFVAVRYKLLPYMFLLWALPLLFIPPDPSWFTSTLLVSLHL